MRVLRIAVLAAAVMVFFFSANAQAEMFRVFVDAFTTNYPEAIQQQMNLRILAFDGTNDHPPTFVKTIRVEAPDQSIFILDPLKDWRPYDRHYWKAYYPSDFKSQKIPSGTYYVTVTPFWGPPIKESDYVVPEFLPFSTVTYPTNNANDVGATPTFTWTPVSGATYYRVLLWNKSANEPVYWWWNIQWHTNFTKITMLPGVLKPKCEYSLRIEARSGSQDLDKRSQSAYVYFTTGSW